MTIAWTADMATGAPVVDQEHRRLIARLNALLSAVGSRQDRGTVEKALREAGDAAVRQFSRDEDCAMRDECPALETNGEARAAFLAVVAQFRRTFEVAGPTDEVAADLELALSSWVGRYIPGEGAAELPCVVNA